jgi:GNAT superfamily N-acetyltransferase
LLRALRDVNDSDIGALDPSLGAWARRPFGRETLAAILLQVSGSAWVSLLNIEPAGFIAIERRATSARVRALTVAPDLRRRGCARALLAQTVTRAADQKLGWVWMDIPAGNTPAIQCALSSGFRRLLPQYLRRVAAGLVLGSAHRVLLSPLRGKNAATAIYEAAAVEGDAGDAWAAGYARMEHPGLPNPNAGSTFMAEVKAQRGDAFIFRSSATRRASGCGWRPKSGLTIWNLPYCARPSTPCSARRR